MSNANQERLVSEPVEQVAEEERNEEHVYSILPLLLAIGMGGGTVAQWELAVSTVSEILWFGSAMMGIIGAIGVIYFLVKLRSWRLWGLIVFGYLLDCLITIILLWPIGGLAGVDPLSLWPYILSTFATFLTGAIIGLLAPKNRILDCALGVVFVDFALAGVSGFFIPQPVTWALVSRIAAAFCAVTLGALLTSYSRSRLKKHKSSKAYRETLWNLTVSILVQCTAAIIAGLVVAFVLE